MSYYKEKKKVFRQLNEIFKSAVIDKRDIDIDKLMFQINLNFEIGEFSVNKMLNVLGTEYGFKVVDKKVIWEELEK